MKDDQVRQPIEGAVADHVPDAPPEPTRADARVARSRRRLSIAGAGLAVVAVIVGGAGVAAHERAGRSAASSPGDLGPFTQAQYAVATHAAKAELARHNDAEVTAVDGTVVTSAIDGDLGTCPIPSLQVTIIGSFPRVGTGGDGPVTSVTISMDPVTGTLCDVGVSTGTPPTFPGAADLTTAVLSS